MIFRKALFHAGFEFFSFLLYSGLGTGDKIYTPYGSEDGINLENYDYFAVIDGNRKKLQVAEITALNVYFKKPDDVETRDLTPLEIVYKNSGRDFLSDPISSDDAVKKGFFDNLDNLWGVIGLAAALLTAVIGVIVSRYKHKRFRSMLYNLNNILKDYIEGKYKIETAIVEQRERINKSLEKGFINENQFLILKTRMDDIETLVRIHGGRPRKLSTEDAEEINQIIQDSTITEKEYTRLIAILTRKES